MPTLQHSVIWDIFAQLLTEVCQQPLSGESFHQRSSNTEDGARSDIRATTSGTKTKEALSLMSGSSILMCRPTVHPLLKPVTEGMSRRRGVHTRSASLKLSTETSPSWSYPLEVEDHLPQLSSRGLQASHLRNTDKCTAGLSPSSDVGSPSAWSTQPCHAFAPPYLLIMLQHRKSAFQTTHWTSFMSRASHLSNWSMATNLNITPVIVTHIIHILMSQPLFMSLLHIGYINGRFMNLNFHYSI